MKLPYDYTSPILPEEEDDNQFALPSAGAAPPPPATPQTAAPLPQDVFGQGPSAYLVRGDVPYTQMEDYFSQIGVPAAPAEYDQQQKQPTDEAALFVPNRPEPVVPPTPQQQPVPEIQRAEGSSGFFGGLADVGRGFAQGVMDIPDMIGDVGGFVERLYEGAPTGEEEQAILNPEPYQPTFAESQAGIAEGDDAFNLRGQAYESGYGMGQNLAGPVGGALAGAAVGALGGGVGAIPGAIAGFMAGMITQIPMYGGATGMEKYENTYRYRINELGDTPEEAHDEAVKAGLTGAAIEVGGEAAMTALTAGLFRALPKNIKSNVIKETAGKLGIWDTAKKVSGLMTGEVTTEMGQEVALSMVDQYYAGGEAPTWENVSKVILPTVLTSGVMFGLGGTLAHKQKAWINDALSNPEVAPETRDAAVRFIDNQVRVNAAKELGEKEANQLADQFTTVANEAIENKKPVTLDIDKFYAKEAERISQGEADTILRGPHTPPTMEPKPTPKQQELQQAEEEVNYYRDQWENATTPEAQARFENSYKLAFEQRARLIEEGVKGEGSPLAEPQAMTDEERDAVIQAQMETPTPMVEDRVRARNELIQREQEVAQRNQELDQQRQLEQTAGKATPGTREAQDTINSMVELGLVEEYQSSPTGEAFPVSFKEFSRRRQEDMDAARQLYDQIKDRAPRLAKLWKMDAERKFKRFTKDGDFQRPDFKSLKEAYDRVQEQKKQDFVNERLGLNQEQAPLLEAPRLMLPFLNEGSERVTKYEERANHLEQAAKLQPVLAQSGGESMGQAWMKYATDKLSTEQTPSLPDFFEQYENTLTEGETDVTGRGMVEGEVRSPVIEGAGFTMRPTETATQGGVVEEGPTPGTIQETQTEVTGNAQTVREDAEQVQEGGVVGPVGQEEGGANLQRQTEVGAAPRNEEGVRRAQEVQTEEEAAETQESTPTVAGFRYEERADGGRIVYGDPNTIRKQANLKGGRAIKNAKGKATGITFSPKAVRSNTWVNDIQFTQTTNSIAQSLPAEQVEARVGELRKRFPNYKILTYEGEQDLPQAILDAKADRGFTKSISAVYHDGKVHMVKDQVTNMRDVESNILHETTHGAGQRMWQKERVAAYNRLLSGLGGRGYIQKWFTERGYNFGEIERSIDRTKTKIEQDADLTDEFLAYYHAHQPYETFPEKLVRVVQEFYGALRDMLRRRGFLELANLGDSDILYLLRSYREADNTNEPGNPLFFGYQPISSLLREDGPYFVHHGQETDDPTGPQFRESELSVSEREALRQWDSAFSASEQRSRERGSPTGAIETPEFRQWFGDSKVVNEDGSPRLVWNSGGMNDFVEFNRDYISSNTQSAGSGYGFFFSPNEQKAAGYGLIPNPRPFYLSIKNPYVMDEQEFLGVRTQEEARMVSDWLSTQGYDGLYISDTDIFVAFTPEQIKHRDNAGGWSAETANIYYSLGKPEPSNDPLGTYRVGPQFALTMDSPLPMFRTKIAERLADTFTSKGGAYKTVLGDLAAETILPPETLARDNPKYAVFQAALNSFRSTVVDMAGRYVAEGWTHNTDSLSNYFGSGYYLNASQNFRDSASSIIKDIQMAQTQGSPIDADNVWSMFRSGNKKGAAELLVKLGREKGYNWTNVEEDSYGRMEGVWNTISRKEERPTRIINSAVAALDAIDATNKAVEGTAMSIIYDRMRAAGLESEAKEILTQYQSINPESGDPTNVFTLKELSPEIQRILDEKITRLNEQEREVLGSKYVAKDVEDAKMQASQLQAVLNRAKKEAQAYPDNQESQGRYRVAQQEYNEFKTFADTVEKEFNAAEERLLQGRNEAEQNLRRVNEKLRDVISEIRRNRERYTNDTSDKVSREEYEKKDAELVKLHDRLVEEVNLAKEDAGTNSTYTKLIEIRNQKEELRNTKQLTGELADNMTRLRKQAYFPLKRYGIFALSFKDKKTNEVVWYNQYESNFARNRAAREMREKFPSSRFEKETGNKDEDAWTMYEGLDPNVLETYLNNAANELSLGEDTKLELRRQMMATYIKQAKGAQSTMNSLLKRKGTEGIEMDVGRTVATTALSNARSYASNLHMKDAMNVFSNVDAGRDRTLHRFMRKQLEYVTEPQEEMQAFRSFMTYWYLLGSPAAAAVNLSQIPLATVPFLTQFAKARVALGMYSQDVTGMVFRALRDAAQRDRILQSNDPKDAALREGLKRAEREGTTVPQEIHNLNGQAMGNRFSRISGKSETAKKLSAGWNVTKMGWSYLFQRTEQFNRETTYIAAFRMALEFDQTQWDKVYEISGSDGEVNRLGAERFASLEERAHAFASYSVNSTQFIMARTNRMRWARGAIGAPLMTFKSFSIQYSFFLRDLYKADKRAFAATMGALFFLAGAGGLPFEEDIEDLLDATIQHTFRGDITSTRELVDHYASMGIDGILPDDLFDSRRGKEAFVRSFTSFMANGISSLDVMPIDIQSRVGMGDLLPTDWLLPGGDFGDSMMEFLGVPGRAATQASNAMKNLTAGGLTDPESVKNFLMGIAPKAAGDFSRGLVALTGGEYRDYKFRKVTDLTPLEASAKMMGFNPWAARKEQSLNVDIRRITQFHSMRKTILGDRLVKAIREGDGVAISDTIRQIDSWNRVNPDFPIWISRESLKRKLKGANLTPVRRSLNSVAKEIRPALTRLVADAGL